MHTHKAGLYAFMFLSGLLSFLTSGWSQQPSPDAFNVAQVQPRRASPGAQATPTVAEGEMDVRTRVNNWTVTILGGYMTGVHIKLATDLETALNDDDNLRILPIVSHGAKQNVLDLLYLKGVDIAFTHADVFEELKKDSSVKNIDKRIQYISQAHVSGMHILVRPEIKTLKDLEGKKVGLHGEGTGVAVTGGIIFERLGIKVQPVYINNTVALEKMKTGELVGLVHMLTKGSEFIRKVPAETGFHLLSVPYGDQFSDYYTPYTIEQADYPNVIQSGQEVETIGVPAVLAVYNWPKDTDRYRRVERFIQYYFTRFDKLKKPPFQPEWKNVNLGAKVPGWTRYSVATDMLVKLQRNELSDRPSGAAQATEAALVPQDARQKQLFNEFLEWKNKNGKE